MIDLVPFTPDHLEFFATVTLQKRRYSDEQVREWLTRLVNNVDMQILMPSKAISCNDLGNEGVSGIVMLKTSHSSIHIWDQCDQPYAKLVIYSCKPFRTIPILDMLAELGSRVCSWELRDRNHTTEADLLHGHQYKMVAEGIVDYRR